jgi:tRNA(fMet)-specific endonuclease VapC
MIRYMLDTNICIYLIRGKHAAIIARLKKAAKHGVAISSITLAELEFGVQNSQHIQQNTMNLMRFLVPFDILPFDESAAREYGKIRADLRRQGKLIGNMDMLIGAHAKSLSIKLVTNNEREFERIEGLSL